LAINLIKPQWPAAKNIRAFCTTRNLAPMRSAESAAAYDSFNLALHVDDDASRVKANRQQLRSELSLPAEPQWLNQVHGQQVVNAAQVSNTIPDADASFSEQPNVICTVLTADCLPVLICNRLGNKVAAAHAGWRGLADGIIENTLTSLNENPDEILVWLGPAIGPKAFEVGEEIREIFINKHSASASAFKQNRSGHFLADIYQLARIRLKAMGIEAVYGEKFCTFTDANQFYSYRRDVKTGRQASLIWFE